MASRGAGGTDGGAWSFLIGIIMMIGGGYLLMKGIIVRPVFGFGTVAFALGGVGVTTGMILVPFLFGVGFIFYNGRSWLGWLLAGGALVALIFGVLSNLNIQLMRMSLFDLLTILVLLVGGMGLFLRSLRSF